jgi:hypothetical protein
MDNSMEAIQAALERIALAFEEQNRISREHMSIQVAQHAEVEATNERRYQERAAMDREHLALKENDSDLYERFVNIQERAAKEALVAYLARIATQEQPTRDTP